MELEAKRRSLGPAFRGLLVATTIMNLGDGVRLAALPLLATTLTDSSLLIAGVTAAQFLPWLVFGPFGGVIVDRADRRELILTTQAWRALVMAGLGAVVLADVASIWMVFAVAFVMTVGEILVDPSVVAIVPAIVGHEDLDHANGRISAVDIVTNDLIGAPVGAGLFTVPGWRSLPTVSATSVRSHRSDDCQSGHDPVAKGSPWRTSWRRSPRGSGGFAATRCCDPGLPPSLSPMSAPQLRLASSSCWCSTLMPVRNWLTERP